MIYPNYCPNCGKKQNCPNCGKKQNCPNCGKKHRKFPRKCETETRILGGIHHAVILYRTSDYDKLLAMDCISPEWKDGLRKDREMREYIRMNDFKDEIRSK